jgi:hypothetical protein
MPELRRQQGAEKQNRRRLDLENSWMAAPVLAPEMAVSGLELAGALGARAGAEALEGPLNFTRRDAWQRTGAALRAQARRKFAKAYGIRAKDMQAVVHHSDPLEYRSLNPNADPNRVANLWPLRDEAHVIANRAWDAFRRSLNGRWPTRAEVMAYKLRVDKLVAPYLRRAGVARSNTPPGEGGPI